jgi:hypothetical protein
MCRILAPGPLIEARALRPVGDAPQAPFPGPQSGRWRPTRTIIFMTSRIARHRARAYLAQRARCYYCQCRMCIGDPSTFARSYGISERLVRRVRCSAEHLTARRDGGTDTRSNIAAVCWHCNRLRHAGKTPMPADRYRDYVRRKISRGAWHVRLVLQNLYSPDHLSRL